MLHDFNDFGGIRMRTPFFTGILLILWFSFPASASDSVRPGDQDILAVMDLSGLTATIMQVPEHMQAGLQTSQQTKQSSISGTDYGTLQKIFSDTFSAQAIKQDVVEYLGQTYDQGRYTSLVELLQSPLAKRMTALEVATGTPEEFQNMLHYATDLATDPPSAKRVALVAELDKVSHATELTATLQIETLRSMLGAFASYSPEGDSATREKMNHIVNGGREQIVTTAHQLVIVSYLYTYRDVSDEDLNNYIAIYRNTDLQWYLDTASSALVKAIENSSVAAGRRIAKHVSAREYKQL